MKRVVIFILLLALALPIFSLSFNSSLLEVGGGGSLLSSGKKDGYLMGFFPLEARYRYLLRSPEAMDELGLSLALDFSSGLKERMLKIDPDSGEEVSVYSSLSSSFYQVQYIYFDLSLREGLVRESFMDEDVVSLYLSLNGRFENAYERFEWLSNPKAVESTFYGQDNKERFSDYSYVPELKIAGPRDMRMLSDFGVSIGAALNWKMETEMTKDGVSADIALSYYPSFLRSERDHSYFLLSLDASVALTLLELPQMSFGPSRGLDALSVYVESEIDFRGAFGGDIPQLSIERAVWGSESYPSSMVLGNRTELVVKGYQITEDLYPSLILFSDVAFSFGGGINGSKVSGGITGSIGGRVEMNFFSIVKAYGEAGYVYKDLYDRNPGFRYALGVKVSV